MSIPQGHLGLKSLRLGTTGGNEIYFCPEAPSFFSGNLSISGVLTASAVVSGGEGLSDLCFPIGVPTNDAGTRPIDISDTSFTNNIGLNLTASTDGCNAFQLIDKYFHTYWLDTPPAPTNPICTSEATKVIVSWTNVPTVEAGFILMIFSFLKM